MGVVGGGMDLALPWSPPGLETNKVVQHPRLPFLGPPPSVLMALYGFLTDLMPLIWPYMALIRAPYMAL